MILVLGPSTARDRWHVSCDTHGLIGWQTTAAYCADRIALHRDETGCDGVAIYVGRDKVAAAWWAECNGCDEKVRRSSKALALGWAQRHGEAS